MLFSQAEAAIPGASIFARKKGTGLQEILKTRKIFPGRRNQSRKWLIISLT